MHLCRRRLPSWRGEQLLSARARQTPFDLSVGVGVGQDDSGSVEDRESGIGWMDVIVPRWKTQWIVLGELTSFL